MVGCGVLCGACTAGVLLHGGCRVGDTPSSLLEPLSVTLVRVLRRAQTLLTQIDAAGGGGAGSAKRAGAADVRTLIQTVGTISRGTVGYRLGACAPCLPRAAALARPPASPALSGAPGTPRVSRRHARLSRAVLSTSPFSLDARDWNGERDRSRWPLASRRRRMRLADPRLTPRNITSRMASQSLLRLSHSQCTRDRTLHCVEGATWTRSCRSSCASAATRATSRRRRRARRPVTARGQPVTYVLLSQHAARLPVVVPRVVPRVVP